MQRLKYQYKMSRIWIPASLNPRMKEVLAFLGQQIKEGKPVLVHCLKGKNQSESAAMGVVIKMLLTGSSFKHAATWFAVW